MNYIRNNRLIKKVIKLFRNLTLKRKLLLLFYVQIIIPIVFIGIVAYSKSSIAIKNKCFDYTQDILRLIGISVESFCNDIDSVSMQMLYDNRIYDFLNSDYSKNPLEQYSNATYIKSVFRDVVFTREGIEGISLMNTNEKFIYFENSKSNKSIINDVPYDYLYEKANEAQGSTTWVNYIGEDNKEDIYGIRMIYNRDSFKPIGLMVILIEEDYLRSIYKDLSPIAYNNIVILSNDNEVIIDNMEVSENIHRMKSRIGSEESNYFIDKSTNSLVSYVTLENPNWKIAYSISLKILYSEIENLRNGIFLIILLSIIVLSIISSLTALDIVNPINRLVEAMKNLEESGKHKYVYINRNDEIGYLAKTFNTMSYNIDNLVNVNYREKLTRKEAQLKALQSQINPHFIFNTLENINWLAQLNGVNEISITVTSLANLMEASIGKGRKNIYFSEELNYINSFIDIFNVRFPDKVTVVRNISEESLNVKIPKLLIEPIVENSLNHGLERISREGELMLSSEIYDNHLIVIVYDNGIGMDKDKLNRLISNMDNSDDDRNICNSIGLLNVNKRIKLFYGEEYGLNIESEKDKFTKVTVKIPINNMNGGE